MKNEIFKDLIEKKRRYAARLKRSLEHHQSAEDRNYCLDEAKEDDGEGERETRDELKGTKIVTTTKPKPA